MKTGILTFHNCTNYGAVFQTYALWKTTDALTGGGAEVIDYENPKISTRLQVETAKKSRSLKGLIRRGLMVPYQQQKNTLFGEFLKRQGMLSERRYSAETLEQCGEIYDQVVFGSDQIWNLTLTGEDYHYFGAFSPKVKKVAYAASVGNFDLSRCMDTVGVYLKEFAALSTREERDQQLLRKQYALPVQHVLDPTFLLEKEQWSRLEEPCQVPERYILLYLISPTPDDFVYAQELSKQTKLPVLYISYSYRWQSGVKNLRRVSPGNFLYLLDHAEYMVTNSFHGTALSINMKKDFYCQLPARKAQSNVRAEEILARFGLESRILRDNDTICPSAVEHWAQVNERLEEARRESLRYLREALEKQQ